MATEEDERASATSMGNPTDDRALRGILEPELAGRARDLPPGPLHARRAGGDGTPVAGGATRGSGSAVRGDRPEDGRLHGHRDEGGALAEPRRGRLPRRDRERGEGSARLTIAVPVKG